MRDRWTVVLAASVVGGALRPSAVPLVLVGVLGAGALLVRRPLPLCLAGALLASALAHRSWSGLDGVEPAFVQGAAVLLTDPESDAGGVRAEVRLGGRHLELRASPTVAGDLDRHLAGESLLVRGELRPLVDPSRWQASRHLAGRLTVARWEPGGAPVGPLAVANGVRRSLSRGAAVLTPRDAALLAGLVLGDDRAQPPELADDFRGAGLTHLLAVSGQNVAFVLALLGPVVRRLRLWPRLLVTVGAIGAFAVLTRFEPSVTRAAAMAALAAATVTVGRPVSRVRVVALGVSALLLVDPLLVGSLGFQLSVAAALAIVVGAEPLARALPGPRWLAEPAAVTIAAQLGVAPLLLAAFGPLPLASLPANLLAVPAAGAVMVWGMTVGVVAGLLPPSGAALAHLPTRLLLGWIELVAARGARLPLGSLGGPAVAASAASLAVAAGATRLGWPRVRAGALAAAAGVVVVTIVVAQAPPPLRDRLQAGLVRWHDRGSEVIVVGGGGWQASLDAEEVLGELRSAGVGAIDVLVVADPAVPASVLEAVAARHPTGRTLVPASFPLEDRPAGAVALPGTPTTLRVGSLEVVVAPGPGRVVVEARPATR